ncbi:hypothetical protein C8R46DRAFT_955167 [Mycena filopes]|nr:hypothetical protein C8R46DRAFT_955167 [Mycena filopes]
MNHASAPAQNLPVEVIDGILDGNRGDRKTLASSSLVCKAWLQSSRYHLFAEFDVYVGLNVGRKFLKLLRNPLCTFVYCIRTITLYPGQPDASGIAPLGDETVTGLAKLKHVSSLRILNHRGLIQKSTLALLASTFGDVETLRLSNSFPAVDDAIEFVVSFPKLKTLDFYPHCHRSTPATLPNTPPPPKLSKVQLHSPFSHISWFVEHPNLVSTLTLTDIKTKDLGKVEEMLTAAGANLRDLRLSFMSYAVATAIGYTNTFPPTLTNITLIGSDFATLLQSSSLRSLELVAPNATLYNLLDFVEHMRLPSLRVLLWKAGNPAINSDSIPATAARIDTVLSNRANFRSLEEVHIVDFYSRLSVQFPKADAVGVAVAYKMR